MHCTFHPYVGRDETARPQLTREPRRKSGLSRPGPARIQLRASRKRLCPANSVPARIRHLPSILRSPSGSHPTPCARPALRGTPCAHTRARGSTQARHDLPASGLTVQRRVPCPAQPLIFDYKTLLPATSYTAWPFCALVQLAVYVRSHACLPASQSVSQLDQVLLLPSLPDLVLFVRFISTRSPRRQNVFPGVVTKARDE